LRIFRYWTLLCESIDWMISMVSFDTIPNISTCWEPPHIDLCHSNDYLSVHYRPFWIPIPLLPSFHPHFSHIKSDYAWIYSIIDPSNLPKCNFQMHISWLITVSVQAFFSSFFRPYHHAMKAWLFFQSISTRLACTDQRSVTCFYGKFLIIWIRLERQKPLALAFHWKREMPFPSMSKRRSLPTHVMLLNQLLQSPKVYLFPKNIHFSYSSN